MQRTTVFAIAALWVHSGAAAGADAVAGRAEFRRQCILCHSAEPADGGGGQGPTLSGVYGRHAAGDPKFAYTAALRQTGLIWDLATLMRFLALPEKLVPGSNMVARVPDAAVRADIIAYLRTTSPTGTSMVAAGDGVASTPKGPDPAATNFDWMLDMPGIVHRIDGAALAKPYASASATNEVQLVERPASARPALPTGFRLELFARNLAGPRKMLAAANGDILVSEMSGGRVTVIHPSEDGTRSAGSDVYLQGLTAPFGLALYPNAEHPQWLYVAQSNRISRYEYRTGDRRPRSAAEVIVPHLPAGGGHVTRDIAFSADGTRMFVSVGSASNVAETMSKKTPAAIRSWEAGHGRGAAWDDETDRAAVMVFKVGSKASGRLYATGLRNCVSLTVQPVNGELWCTVNERDGLGDDLVPDYSTRVREGGYYGWPWYYLGAYEEPRLQGDRPDLRGRALVPDVLYQAHSAPLDLMFYSASHGPSAFPDEYIGDAFAVFHGSWNRGSRTGYKIVRVRMTHGVPSGNYEDFLTGFIVDNAKVWGRPVALLELGDGSMLLSDDAANVIYRISYAPVGEPRQGSARE